MTYCRTRWTRRTAKHGLAIPGGRIPIQAVDVLRERRPHSVLILTWDIADEIVAQLETAGWGCRVRRTSSSPARVHTNRVELGVA